MKRRTLLEKKIAQELEKAKTYTKAQNKRGMLLPPTHPLVEQHLSPLDLQTLMCRAWVYEPKTTVMCLPAFRRS